MKLYTKTGDAGDTGLFGGERVRKDHERVRTYGALDEANSTVGMAAAAPDLPPSLRAPLQAVPEALAGLPLTLEGEGHTLVYTFDTQQEETGIGELLKAVPEMELAAATLKA